MNKFATRAHSSVESAGSDDMIHHFPFGKKLGLDFSLDVIQGVYKGKDVWHLYMRTGPQHFKIIENQDYKTVSNLCQSLGQAATKAASY